MPKYRIVHRRIYEFVIDAPSRPAAEIAARQVMSSRWDDAESYNETNVAQISAQRAAEYSEWAADAAGELYEDEDEDEDAMDS